MAFKTIKRPKLSIGERFYLQSILGGLWLTLKHMILALAGKSRNKKQMNGNQIGVTMQYPEVRWDDHLPEYYRGYPVLVKGEDGRERCVSCQLCEFICPARAITITPGEIPAGSNWDKVEKAPKEFQIDMLRCIYCGMCEEACPEQAIFLSKNYLLTPTDKSQSIHNKAKLYELGGTRKGLVNKWNQYK